MKKKYIRINNCFTSFILSLLGVGSAFTFMGCEYGVIPAAEYGTPCADFKVMGKVTNQTEEAIRDIQVVMHYDTVYTDENGDYAISVREFPDKQTFVVEFNDVDGEQNGAFASTDSLVVFEEDSEYKNGDGSWYKGETTTELNIKLNNAE